MTTNLRSSRGRLERGADPEATAFVSRVLVEVRRAGGAKQSGSAAKRPGSRIGRGFTASRLHRSSLGPRARHVVIKTRVVVLNTAGAAAMSAHLRYIARDGVTRDGEAARSYSARADRVDLRDFQTRGAHDRHQFRFIVAPEDATELRRPPRLYAPSDDASGGRSRHASRLGRRRPLGYRQPAHSHRAAG